MSSSRGALIKIGVEMGVPVVIRFAGGTDFNEVFVGDENGDEVVVVVVVDNVDNVDDGLVDDDDDDDNSLERKLRCSSTN
jgi:hypothetical protein